MADPWSVLGLRPTADRRAVRRAYARRLKEIDQDRERVAFQELREAYEAVLAGTSAPAAPAPAPEPAAAPFPAVGDADPAGFPADAVDPDAFALEVLERLGALPWRRETREPEAGEPREDGVFPGGGAEPFGRDSSGAPSRDPAPERAEIPAGRGPDGPPVAVRVADWMERIFRTAEEEGEETAVAVLDELDRSGELVALPLRERLEEDLLYRLAAEGPVPWKVLARTRDLFGWGDSARHLARMLGPIERKRLETRLVDLDEAERLRERAARGDVPAAVLTGPWRPLAFHRIALREKTFRPVADEVLRLRSLHPGVLEGILDPRVARWWDTRCDRPRVYLRDVFVAVLLAWVVVPSTGHPILGTLGIFALVVAGSFGLQVWKSRTRVGFDGVREWPLFWVAWLLSLPLEAPFALLFLPAVYVFFFSLGVLRFEMGRLWFWLVGPACGLAGVIVLAASPWQRGVLWAPGLVFLVAWASGPGADVRFRGFLRWGWVGVAAVLAGLAVASGGAASEEMAFGLLAAGAWALIGAALGRRWARFELPLLAALLVPLALDVGAPLPGGWDAAIGAGLEDKIRFGWLLVGTVAAYHGLLAWARAHSRRD